MMITEKNKKVIYIQENDDLKKEKVNKLLKNNNVSSGEKTKSKSINNI